MTSMNRSCQHSLFSPVMKRSPVSNNGREPEVSMNRRGACIASFNHRNDHVWEEVPRRHIGRRHCKQNALKFTLTIIGAVLTIGPLLNIMLYLIVWSQFSLLSFQQLQQRHLHNHTVMLFYLEKITQRQCNSTHIHVLVKNN